MDLGLPFVNHLSAALSSLPAADRASFAQLSVSDMLAWTVTKAEEYHRYTLALHSMQNALAPIHRLPTEVLSSIFIEAWQDRKSLRLTHVCRLWRSLLLDTSKFWAIAIAGDEFYLPSSDKEPPDEEYLAVACKRSASRTLSLRLSSLSPRGHLQLIQLARRITCLQLSTRGGNDLEWLWKVLRAGMPRLEDFAICLRDSPERVSDPHGLFPRKLPRLTRLTLPAILFPFCQSWRLGTIQEIALRSDRVGPSGHRSAFRVPWVSLDAVLDYLNYYSNLRTLEIDDEVLVGRNDACRVVDFPKLERLRVAAHPGTMSTALSHMSFPLSAYVDLEIISDPPQRGDDDQDDHGWIIASTEPSPQPDPFNPDSPRWDDVVAQIDQVTIENGPSPTVRGYTDSAERFRIRYVGGEYNRARESERSLTRLFTRTDAPVSHLLLITPPRAEQSSSPARFACPFSTGILAAFPRLTHLSVRSPDAVSFLFSLSPAGTPSSYRRPARRMPPFSSLMDLTLGIERSRGHESLAPLRRLDAVAADERLVARDFRETCTALAIGLSNRSRDGRRPLSRLEFFVYEEGCMAEAPPPPLVSHVDLAALHPALTEDSLRMLKGLVNGLVVFSGYRVFTQAPEVQAHMS